MIRIRRFCRLALVSGVLCSIVGTIPAVAADGADRDAHDSPPDRSQRVLLIGQGPDGHPYATHEFMAGVNLLAGLLNKTPRLQTIVVKADGPWSDGPELLDGADAAVLYLAQGARWIQQDASRLAAFQRLAERGGGLSVLHWGMGTKDPQYIDEFVKLFGGCHGGPDRKYKVLTARAELASPGHPVLRAISPFEVEDEFYYALKVPRPADAVAPLIQVSIDGARQTVGWAWPRADGGRSFGFSGLHFHKNWELEPYRRLVAQGVLWTLRRAIPEDGLDVDVADGDLKLPPPPSPK